MRVLFTHSRDTMKAVGSDRLGLLIVILTCLITKSLHAFEVNTLPSTKDYYYDDDDNTKDHDEQEGQEDSNVPDLAGQYQNSRPSLQDLVGSGDGFTTYKKFGDFDGKREYDGQTSSFGQHGNQDASSVKSYYKNYFKTTSSQQKQSQKSYSYSKSVQSPNSYRTYLVPQESDNLSYLNSNEEPSSRVEAVDSQRYQKSVDSSYSKYEDQEYYPNQSKNGVLLLKLLSTLNPDLRKVHVVLKDVRTKREKLSYKLLKTLKRYLKKVQGNLDASQYEYYRKVVRTFKEVERTSLVNSNVNYNGNDGYDTLETPDDSESQDNYPNEAVPYDSLDSFQNEPANGVLLLRLLNSKQLDLRRVYEVLNYVRIKGEKLSLRLLKTLKRYLKKVQKKVDSSQYEYYRKVVRTFKKVERSLVQNTNDNFLGSGRSETLEEPNDDESSNSDSAYNNSPLAQDTDDSFSQTRGLRGWFQPNDDQSPDETSDEENEPNDGPKNQRPFDIDVNKSGTTEDDVDEDQPGFQKENFDFPNSSDHHQQEDNDSGTSLDVDVYPSNDFSNSEEKVTVTPDSQEKEYPESESNSSQEVPSHSSSLEHLGEFNNDRRDLEPDFTPREPQPANDNGLESSSEENSREFSKYVQYPHHKNKVLFILPHGVDSQTKSSHYDDDSSSSESSQESDEYPDSNQGVYKHKSQPNFNYLDYILNFNFSTPYEDSQYYNKQVKYLLKVVKALKHRKPDFNEVYNNLKKLLYTNVRLPAKLVSLLKLALNQRFKEVATKEYRWQLVLNQVNELEEKSLTEPEEYYGKKHDFEKYWKDRQPNSDSANNKFNPFQDRSSYEFVTKHLQSREFEKVVEYYYSNSNLKPKHYQNKLYYVVSLLKLLYSEKLEEEEVHSYVRKLLHNKVLVPVRLLFLLKHLLNQKLQNVNYSKNYHLVKVLKKFEVLVKESVYEEYYNKLNPFNDRSSYKYVTKHLQFKEFQKIVEYYYSHSNIKPKYYQNKLHDVVALLKFLNSETLEVELVHNYVRKLLNNRLQVPVQLLLLFRVLLSQKLKNVNYSKDHHFVKLVKKFKELEVESVYREYFDYDTPAEYPNQPFVDSTENKELSPFNDKFSYELVTNLLRSNEFEKLVEYYYSNSKIPPKYYKNKLYDVVLLLKLLNSQTLQEKEVHYYVRKLLNDKVKLPVQLLLLLKQLLSQKLQNVNHTNNYHLIKVIKKFKELEKQSEYRKHYDHDTPEYPDQPFENPEEYKELNPFNDRSYQLVTKLLQYKEFEKVVKYYYSHSNLNRQYNENELYTVVLLLKLLNSDTVNEKEVHQCLRNLLYKDVRLPVQLLFLLKQLLNQKLKYVNYTNNYHWTKVVVKFEELEKKSLDYNDSPVYYPDVPTEYNKYENQLYYHKQVQNVVLILKLLQEERLDKKTIYYNFKKLLQNKVKLNSKLLLLLKQSLKQRLRNVDYHNDYYWNKVLYVLKQLETELEGFQPVYGQSQKQRYVLLLLQLLASQRPNVNVVYAILHEILKLHVNLEPEQVGLIKNAVNKVFNDAYSGRQNYKSLQNLKQLYQSLTEGQL